MTLPKPDARAEMNLALAHSEAEFHYRRGDQGVARSAQAFDNLEAAIRAGQRRYALSVLESIDPSRWATDDQQRQLRHAIGELEQELEREAAAGRGNAAHQEPATAP